MKPTFDDAIAVLAKQAGTRPDSAHVAEFLVDFGAPWGNVYEPRVCEFQHNPRVRQEAENLLRIHEQVEMIALRMKPLPRRNPARPSMPTA